MWYTVSLLFESVHEGLPSNTDLWEQRVILFDASSEEDAVRQARCFALDHQESYISATGDRVQWLFREVAAVFSILDADLKPCTEVFGQFLKAAEADSLMKSFPDTPGTEDEAR
jgi:hypothetical protein